MAETDGDKTEAPTPRRRQEARDQGRIARSPDLTAALLLVGITVLLGTTGGTLWQTLELILAGTLRGQIRITGGADVMPTFAQLTLLVGRAMAPLFGGILLVAIFANWVQVGFHPNLKKIQPKFPFNPIAGFKKIFGGGSRGPVQLGMNLLKMLLVGTVAYSAIHGRMAQIVSVASMEALAIFNLACELVYTITLRIGIVLLVLAIIDYAYQRWKIEQELKMTKQEVKEEMKRMEGDPQIKARRRQIQMQQAMKRIKSTVPTADVIVTNPTHFAVALKYEPGMAAPRVVAKGADHLALKIREIAGEHGIPIIERPPLARALYKLCQVGQEIPEQFYSAVAEILAYVYELTGKSRRRKVPA